VSIKKSYPLNIVCDQNDAKTWVKEGYTLCGMGQYHNALICFHKALSLQPYDEEAIKGKVTVLNIAKK
jgi:hypothetical protein